MPGVDDGARTADDTLDGVTRMRAVGIDRIMTTPHLDGSLTLNPRALESHLDQVDESWDHARGVVSREEPDVDFRLGYEIKLDVPDPDLSDERLRFEGTNFVLVEWPRMSVPPSSPAVLRRLRDAGVRPIIAHPERYYGMDPDLDIVVEWRRAGAYLQTNYGSLLGRYGPDARTLALRLLKRGWVEYLSSDFHGREHLELYKNEAFEKLEAIGGAGQLELLSGANPRRLFRGEEPLPVPPLSPGTGFWGRVKELFGGVGSA